MKRRYTGKRAPAQQAALPMLCLALLCPMQTWSGEQLADLPDPTRPYTQAAPRPAARLGESSKLVLESTLVSPRRRLAVVNGHTLTVGDSIENVKITAITPYEVVADRNGHKLRLRLLPRDAASNKRLGKVDYVRAGH